MGLGRIGTAAVLRAKGDTETAEAHYRTALSLDADLPEAWSGLGAMLIHQERWEEALEVTKDAMDASPDDPEAYLAAAALEPDRAFEFFEALQEITAACRVEGGSCAASP